MRDRLPDPPWIADPYGENEPTPDEVRQREEDEGEYLWERQQDEDYKTNVGENQ